MADKTITLGSDGTQKGLKDLGSSVYGDKVAVYDGDLSAAIAAALAAGADIPVTLAPAAYGSKVSITRPADTTAYTAGDVIGIGTGAGGATAGPAALTFAGVGPAGGGEVMITSASLLVKAASVPAGMGNMRLHLYSVTPPSALVDNAAWSLADVDCDSYLGYVDLGTPVALGANLYVPPDGINKQITLAGADVYGYLQTIGAFTPTSACVKSISLHTLRV